MKSRFILIRIIGLILLMLPLVASAEHQYDDFEYTVLDNNTICITDWFGLEDSCIVPDTIDGYSVSTIGQSAFEGKSMQMVTLPASVVEIGKKSFANCKNLQQVILSNNITVIPEEAFASSYNLVLVNYPIKLKRIDRKAFYYTQVQGTLPEGLFELGEWAFYGSHMTDLFIPASLRVIGDSAFAEMDRLQKIEVADGNTILKAVNNVLFSIDGKRLIRYPTLSANEEYTIPTGVEVLENGSFSCSNKLKHIKIPEGVTTIGENCFWCCRSLNMIVLPDSVTEIKGGAFGYSASNIQLSKGLKHLGEWAFQENGFSEIELPEGLESVGSFAFDQCYNLREITIPKSLTELPTMMFYHCTALKNVYIPVTVTVMYESTFYECPKVVVNAIEGSYAAQFCKDHNIPYITFPCTEHIVVIDEAVMPTDTTTGLTEGSHCSFCNKVIIAQKEIPPLNNMSVLRLPSALNTIKNEAFSNLLCEAVIIPEGCTSIGEYAFSDCRYLIYVKIPSSIDKYPESAFKRCNDNLVIDWAKK